MPVRMCIVCRNRAEKSGLIRMVVKDGEAVVDKTAKIQSRGFYLCADCLGLAKKKRVLERILKHSVEPAAYDRLLKDAGGGDNNNE